MLKVIAGGIAACSADVNPTSIISPSTCIYFVLSGQGVCDNRSLGAGDGFFVKKDSFIQFAPAPDDPWTYAWFSIDGEDIDGDMDTISGDEGAGIFSLSAVSANDIVIALCPNGTYASLGDTFDTAAAKLILSFPTVKTRDVFCHRSGKQHVDAAIKYINQNLSTDMKVEQIAAELGIDRKYLRNLFTFHMGMSTMDYIMKTRMERAKDLLNNSTATVSLVARSVGYRDVLCFSKAFKNYTGLSPTDFRAGEKPKAVKDPRSVKTPEPEELPKPKKKKDQMPVFYL